MKQAKLFLDRLLSGICVVLFAGLTIVVLWQVYSRQVLNTSSSWTTVLSQYLLVWLAFLGAALVFSEKGHIAVDFFIAKAPARIRVLAATAIQLFVLAFAIVLMSWGGLRLASQSWSVGVPALPIPAGPLHLVMPVAGALIAFYAINELLSVWRQGATGPLPGDERPGLL